MLPDEALSLVDGYMGPNVVWPSLGGARPVFVDILSDELELFKNVKTTVHSLFTLKAFDRLEEYTSRRFTWAAWRTLKRDFMRISGSREVVLYADVFTSPRFIQGRVERALARGRAPDETIQSTVLTLNSDVSQFFTVLSKIPGVVAVRLTMRLKATAVPLAQKRRSKKGTRKRFSRK